MFSANKRIWKVSNEFQVLKSLFNDPAHIIYEFYEFERDSRQVKLKNQLINELNEVNHFLKYEVPIELVADKYYTPAFNEKVYELMENVLGDEWIEDNIMDHDAIEARDQLVSLIQELTDEITEPLWCHDPRYYSSNY